jgi:hypothetical protein
VAATRDRDLLDEAPDRHRVVLTYAPMKPPPPLRAIAVLLALVAAAPAAADTVRYQRFRGLEDVTVAGAQVNPYRLRLSYRLPATWHARGKASGVARTFGPVGRSCRFTVRVSARAVADAAGQTAGTRLAGVLPAKGRALLDQGTRRNAAWRIVRGAGSDFTGLLVRPAPTVREQPANGRVWLEVRFSARADPSASCNIGRARVPIQQTGDALATAEVGGFDLTPRSASPRSRSPA